MAVPLCAAAARAGTPPLCCLTNKHAEDLQGLAQSMKCFEKLETTCWFEFAGAGICGLHHRHFQRLGCLGLPGGMAGAVNGSALR